VGDGCKGGGGGMPDDMEVARDFGELVPMGHPDLENPRVSRYDFAVLRPFP
jgi:hypothetical protein